VGKTEIEWEKVRRVNSLCTMVEGVQKNRKLTVTVQAAPRPEGADECLASSSIVRGKMGPGGGGGHLGGGVTNADVQNKVWKGIQKNGERVSLAI